MPNLTPADLQAFSRFKISAELLTQAGVRRVTDPEARADFGFNSSGDNAGIVFPYISALTGHRVTARLRRDHPPVEDGKPKGKYLLPYGDRRHLYFVPGCAPLLDK